jgi:hypothetical protein
VRCAGSADAARRLLATIVLAAAAASGPVAAQAPAAQEAYQAGIKALSEHRFADARTALLEAVRVDPSFAGAWLDLAIATEADGDPVQAEEFLDILEARFQLPPTIAAGVAQLRAQIHGRAATLATNEWRWTHQAQVAAGHDSNANSGLALPDLTLTLPGGAVVLPVGPAQLPRPDNYVVTSFNVEALRKAGEGEWQLTGGARARANAQVHAYDTTELQAGAAYIGSRPAWNGAWAQVFPGPWRAGLSAQQLTLGGTPLLETVSATAVHAWTGFTCGPQAGVEFGWRKFPSTRNLDSNIGWLSGSAMCSTPFLGARSSVTLQAKLGRENARHAFESALGRPGNDTRHLDFTVLERWTRAGPWGPERLEAQLTWASANDTAGYSPLLASNAARRVQRTSVGFAYNLPLPPFAWAGDDWSLTASAQAFWQSSNLEIFRVNGRVLQITLQKTW